ncbi:hypothetical protein GXP67_30925 [Rhodocytophaga rosea]|uniref:Uncharacterized protein n=1 Tax=Rhodocytophaga rosea TaxID=2704465 RepID=A0A6C0GRQ7_9BACT|nr:hypothetical protein [Rhodocytophaga rosea]QHT70749.1 hypothetical protein GXP67_30925 [Rhodocytophaga rosea]
MDKTNKTSGAILAFRAGKCFSLFVRHFSVRRRMWLMMTALLLLSVYFISLSYKGLVLSKEIPLKQGLPANPVHP